MTRFRRRPLSAGESAAAGAVAFAVGVCAGAGVFYLARTLLARERLEGEPTAGAFPPQSSTRPSET